jgi:nitrate reductase alpha subunit
LSATGVIGELRDCLGLGDPVAAWAEITADPQRTARYKDARGMGGFVRSSWPEVSELIAAAHVHTISAFGPDRVVGFSPIPAMSQVSYSAGTRFLSMIGGTILSFYDWYADMPIASPQVFGDQTDVPESADWWNSSYLMIWGTNLPITRTPDAHSGGTLASRFSEAGQGKWNLDLGGRDPVLTLYGMREDAPCVRDATKGHSGEVALRQVAASRGSGCGQPGHSARRGL